MSAQRECFVNLAASAAALASWPVATAGGFVATWSRGWPGGYGRTVFASQDRYWLFRGASRHLPAKLTVAIFLLSH